MSNAIAELAEKAKSSKLDGRSKELRRLVIGGLQGARKGHIGSALSLIEIVRVLYDNTLNYKIGDLTWPERDRFILSKGHGCLGLYAILADKGFISKDELSTYSKEGSRLGGCCEELVPGIEATTGALGHGLSIGVGMAKGALMRKRNNRVFVLLGDGEMGEGSIWEAALSASKHNLTNLITIIDDNKVQLAGYTKDISCFGSLADKWSSFGFEVKEVNGHDIQELESVFEEKPKKNPMAIICHTVKGKGISFAENDSAWHWKNKISDDLINQMYVALEDY